MRKCHLFEGLWMTEIVPWNENESGNVTLTSCCGNENESETPSDFCRRASVELEPELPDLTKSSSYALPQQCLHLLSEQSHPFFFCSHLQFVSTISLLHSFETFCCSRCFFFPSLSFCHSLVVVVVVVVDKLRLLSWERFHCHVFDGLLLRSFSLLPPPICGDFLLSFG